MYLSKITNWDYKNGKMYSSNEFCEYIKEILGEKNHFSNLLLKLINNYGISETSPKITKYELTNLNATKKISQLLTYEKKDEVILSLFSRKIKCEFLIPNILVKNKIKVLLLTQKYNFGGLENIMKINADYCSDYFDIKIGSFVKSDNKDIISFNDSINELINYIEKNNIKIIDLHYTLFNLEKISKYCKIVYTNHNSYFWLDNKTREIIINNDQYIDAYVNVSENVKNTSVNIFKNNNNKSYVVNNGVIINSEKKSDEILNININYIRKFDKKILCTASILPDKGQYELVCAFKLYLEVYPNSILILLGKIADNNYYNKIINFIEKNNIKKNVIQLCCPSQEVIYYTKMSDICVLTSYVEGCSQSIKEWILENKRILVTNVGSNVKLASNYKNIYLINVPFGIKDVDTQSKYFDFLFNKDKDLFIDLIRMALINNINKEIEVNTSFTDLDYKIMNKKKELIYYCVLNNLEEVLNIYK